MSHSAETTRHNMICFFTSSPFCDGGGLNHANGFYDRLRRVVFSPCVALDICSSPDDAEKNDFYAGLMRHDIENAGFPFSEFAVLDRRNADQTAELVEKAELIILAGGHVPTQNRFFEEIGLRSALKKFHGVLIGISAGTMNSAETVYAHPELDGEAVSEDYSRFLPGLGLTKANVLPHYNQIRGGILDGLRLFEDVAYPDSMGRKFYVLPDGSYIYAEDGKEILCGEAWLIQDGKMTYINSDESVIEI